MFKDLEPRFFELVRALQEFGDSIVFVGGWLPFLYVRHLWKREILPPIFTEDIDIGIRHFHGHKKTLEECLEKQPFIEEDKSRSEDEALRFLLLDREKKYCIDVITGDPDPGQFTKLAGKRLEVINSLNNFDILVNPKHTFVLDVLEPAGERLAIRVPTPGAYLYHKGITFEERRQGSGVDYKFKKDLWSIFYVLANVPEVEKAGLFRQIRAFSEDSDYPGFLDSLKRFFGTTRSKGVTHVASFYPDLGAGIRGSILLSVQELLRSLEKA